MAGGMPIGRAKEIADLRLSKSSVASGDVARGCVIRFLRGVGVGWRINRIRPIWRRIGLGCGFRAARILGDERQEGGKQDQTASRQKHRVPNISGSIDFSHSWLTAWKPGLERLSA